MFQSPEESSYSFALRCTELSQKILIASTKSDIKFGKILLDKMFCHTLERGFSSSTYVLQKIRHLLRTVVSDEELIFEVTKASAAEKELLHSLKGISHYG